MDLTSSPEFQLVLQLLSPDYLWSAAERYGRGDAIKGAREAYTETRKLIRILVNNAREREKREQGLDRLPKDLEFAMLMRSLGLPLFTKISKLETVEDEGWRRVTCAFWPNGQGIPGGMFVDVPQGKSYEDVYCATVIATSHFLKIYPQFNRAVLDGRVWSRSDNLVMVHFEVRNDLRSMVMDAADKSPEWVSRKLKKGLRAAVRFSKSEMGRYSEQLLIEWARAGFLGSPAGAMVSGCPGVQFGWSALVPCNGIPITVCVNDIYDGKCFLGITPDHRAFDGKIAAYLHQFLYGRIREILYDL